VLVAGVAFAIPQFIVSNYHGPWLVDVIAAMVSMAALGLFLRVWHPSKIYLDTTRDGTSVDRDVAERQRVRHQHSGNQVVLAWMPWVILSVLVFVWGIPEVKKLLDGIFIMKFPMSGLDQMIQRVPPVVAKAKAEGAVFNLNLLSATGTGIFIAALLAGGLMRIPFGKMVRTYFETIYMVRYSLVTIAAMLALGFTTRFSGVDATLGLAFAHTGAIYPFFGTMLGWLGVALTGSDTASNVLFGSLQKISAEQLGLSPTLMAAANSSGGVMGKMIDAQSIVVASTATGWFGHEGDILRYVFFHSLALAGLMGVLVMLQAYVPPFTSLVVH